MMHELSLISSVIDSLENLSRQERWGPLERVTLRVGAMRQVVPQIMEFAFKTASKGTLLEGAALRIETVPIVIRCRRCGRRWGEERMGFICPACGAGDAEMETGMELDIDSVEVNEDDAKKD